MIFAVSCTIARRKSSREKKSYPPNFRSKDVFRDNLSTVEINVLNGKHEYTLKRKWKNKLVRVRVEFTTLALSAPRSAD